MSDADNSSFANFGKFVPGFDFLQNLATQAAGNAGQKTPQIPSLGSWVAPTLNVEELDKRIQELKAVQFWLDQNALALKATIQALEVQKMTLSTLKGMNFNMGEMANAFKLKMPDMMMPGMTGNGAQQPTDNSKAFPGLEIPPTSFQKSRAARAEEEAEEEEDEDSDEQAQAGVTQGVVDPMQWWGALTQQFQTIAADAMKDAAQKTAQTARTARTNTSPAIKRAKTQSKAASTPAATKARVAKSSALRSNQAWPLPAAFSMAPQTKPKPAAKTARKTSR